MVSNFDRIYREIERESHHVASNCGLEPASVVDLIMSIVDLEDQNRVMAIGKINQKVKGMIQNATPHSGATEDS